MVRKVGVSGPRGRLILTTGRGFTKGIKWRGTDTSTVRESELRENGVKMTDFKIEEQF